MDILLNTVLTIASMSAKNTESQKTDVLLIALLTLDGTRWGVSPPHLALWYFSWYLPPHPPYSPPLPSPRIPIFKIKSVHPDSRRPWWVHSQGPTLGCARSKLGRLKKEPLLMKLGCISLARANSVTFAEHSSVTSKHTYVSSSRLQSSLGRSSHLLASPTTDTSACACLTLPGIHSESTKKHGGKEEKGVFFPFLLPGGTVPAELQDSTARDQPREDAGVARELPCSQLARQLHCDICTPLAPQEQGLARVHRGTSLAASQSGTAPLPERPVGRRREHHGDGKSAQLG